MVPTPSGPAMTANRGSFQLGEDLLDLLHVTVVIHVDGDGLLRLAGSEDESAAHGCCCHTTTCGRARFPGAQK
jgi:hypothetical protein